MVGNFNIPLTSMERSYRQKINKETSALNNMLNQMDLTHIYRIFYPKATQYTFFSSVYGTSSKIDHMLGHRSSLNKFKKTAIISSIFSNHSGMK